MLHFFKLLLLKLSGIEQGLHQVREWLTAAPELANVPKTVDSLKNNVASLGSQISDLDVTVKGLKSSYNNLQQDQTSLKANLTDLSVSSCYKTIKKFAFISIFSFVYFVFADWTVKSAKRHAEAFDAGVKRVED